MDSLENLSLIGNLYSSFLKSKIEKKEIEIIETRVNNFVNFLIDNSQNESKERLREKSDNVVKNWPVLILLIDINNVKKQFDSLKHSFGLILNEENIEKLNNYLEYFVDLKKTINL